MVRRSVRRAAILPRRARREGCYGATVRQGTDVPHGRTLLFRLCLPLAGEQGAAARRAALRHAHRLSARPRPHHLQQGIPAPEKQDAGLLFAGRGSLPHPHDAYHRRFADRPLHRPLPRPQRGPRRGDRARARPRPYPLRPRRRARARQPLAARVRAQRAVAARRRRTRKGRPRPQFDL